MDNKNIIQLGVLVTILVLGILRMQDNTNFPFMVFLNSFSLFVTILFLLYTCKSKIKEKKLRREITRVIIDIKIAATILLGIPLVIYLSYYKEISLPVADFLSIIALGISIATDALSSIIVQENKR